MNAVPVPGSLKAHPRVDAHLHLSRWWPDVRRTAYSADLEYSVPGLLAEMDRYGIDYAVTIQLFQAPSTREALDEGRSHYAASGGRLLPVATVDPTQGSDAVTGALDLVDREPSLFGIKLFPGYQPFLPHDRRVDPIYEFAHRRRLPVLVHQGDTLEGLGLLKFARPIEIDEVAARFRDVNFVLCHLGNPWIDEAAAVVYKNPNVYADTSGLLPPPRAPYFQRAVEQAREAILRAVVTSEAPDRLLHGSDWPLTELGLAVEEIESLPLRAEDIAAILGGNALRLFAIPLSHPEPRP